LSKSRKIDGKSKKKSVILAEVVIDAILDGLVILPNGREVSLEPREWIDLTKFVFLHVDGPVKAQLELSTDKDRPLLIGTFDYAASVAAITTGSSEDSESSGED
jgi:hypothetical protein